MTASDKHGGLAIRVQAHREIKADGRGRFHAMVGALHLNHAADYLEGLRPEEVACAACLHDAIVSLRCMASRLRRANEVGS